MGVGGQCHALAALLPGKTQYPLYRRLGGPLGRSGQVWKISPPSRIRSPDRPAHSKSLWQPHYLNPYIYSPHCVYGLAAGLEGTYPWKQKTMWTEYRNLTLKTE